MRTHPTITANKPYSSEWLGLSEHLIACFYQVEKGDNGVWARKPTSPDVYAPLTEANMSVLLNWQSPFEHAGPESKAPTLAAMLQSGAIRPVIDSVAGAAKEMFGLNDNSAANQIQQNASQLFRNFEGRTGITKLNSMQVFSGMPPVKIQVTALFRAWRDSVSEVEAPFDKLMEWALPVYLDKDSTLLSRAADALRGSRDWVDALMPSVAPVVIGMTYKRRSYLPLVIESIDMPMGSPVGSDGRYVELLVPMTLCSLTAIDRKDWADWATPI